MKKLGLAACAAFALTATGASASGYWQSGTQYSYPAATSQSIPAYTTPGTAVVGYVGPVETAPTVTYTQPGSYTSSYTTVPATTTTQQRTYYTAPQQTYTAPVQTYTAPQQAYATPQQAYTTPSYTTPSYTTPTTTFVRPAPRVYAPAPTVVVPAYAVPRYNRGRLVRDRIRNQRNRIDNALARGDLRPREEERLRERLREIRHTFRDFRRNDGRIGPREEARLMQMLNRNDRRILRLANNDRVVRSHGPYYAY